MGKSVRYFARREALKVIAAVAVAGVAPTVLFGRQTNKRRELEVPWPGYDSFFLGQFEITTIFDGGSVVDVGAGYFGIGQDEQEVASLLASRFLPSGRTIENVVPTIVDTGDELVLFDTGMGSLGEDRLGGQLRSRMKTSGYEPEDVTAVVLTHLHADNIGGLVHDGLPAFPAATRYFIGETEYKYWTETAAKDAKNRDLAALVKTFLEPAVGRIELLKDGDAVFDGIAAVETFGHTPGHMAFEVTAGERSLLIAGDVATHHVVSFERPEWHSENDMDRAAAADTRLRVLADAAQRRIPIIGYHLPFPPVGFVEQNETAFRWVPETYQLSL